jgi:hypothetical protein
MIPNSLVLLHLYFFVVAIILIIRVIYCYYWFMIDSSCNMF